MKLLCIDDVPDPRYRGVIRKKVFTLLKVYNGWEDENGYQITCDPVFGLGETKSLDLYFTKEEVASSFVKVQDIMINKKD